MTNKRLLNAFKLSSKLTVYIPATFDVDKPIDSQPHIDKCAALLSDCFGGATSTPALGYWTSAKGLVKEETTLVFAYCSDENLKKHMDSVVDFCESLKRELKQESIALELNGEMYFI